MWRFISRSPIIITTVRAPSLPTNIAHMMTILPLAESLAVVSPIDNPVVVTAETASKKSASWGIALISSVTRSAPSTSTMNISNAVTMTMDSLTISEGIVRKETVVTLSNDSRRGQDMISKETKQYENGIYR